MRSTKGNASKSESEVVLIYSKCYLQIWLKLLIRTSENCLVLCFVGNRLCNSPLCGSVVPATMPSSVNSAAFTAYEVGRLAQDIPLAGYWVLIRSMPRVSSWAMEFKSTISVFSRKTTKQTNLSYLATWASRLVTMSILGGQINTTQPSYVGGWPLNQLTISVWSDSEAERSWSTECCCVFLI